MPTGSVLVEVAADPLVTVTGEPTGVEPFSNCTVPGALESVTVAVRVTELPDCCGLVGLAARTVVVAIGAVTVKVVLPVEPL